MALLGGTAAACSSDVGRFQNPNQSPFAAQSAPAYTGSIAAAPTGQVQSAPMAAPSYNAPRPVAAAPQGYGAAPAYGAPQPSYGAQPGYGAPQTYGAAPPSYGAPQQPQQLASVSPAQQPLYGTYAAPAAAPVRQPAPVAAAPVQPPPVLHAPAAVKPSMAAAGAAHVVASGETLNSLSRRYNVPVSQIAAANGLDTNAQMRIGQSVVIPGASTATLAAKPAAAPAPLAAAKPAATTPVTTTAAAPAPAAPTAIAAAPAAAKPAVAAKPAPAVVAAAPVAAPAEPKPQVIAAVKPTEPVEESRTASGVQFRWPVRGRIISGYGPKPGGQTNEGINVSVPEGTSVKAAEDGVVAYAGSELKGYGNLVLIKHSDGWVTAYAHNSALDVKKGDTVKRGQVIAKAGQTGNVNSPQVHFEIRKGSQAVDPSQYLAGL
ncbi:murein DD-endopeptidase MepM/ murein hydrolase activator NlpD [Ancylobacter sp. 3268]|uniref:peptidoglycan DD-metalloendopeptidase family protein n=1 Tax=Ancylobacter sp. 3268 TaxID=2817752 RepID=UPI002865FFC7|nr:peptidoglycan DD-metalloendopeptidase family protein [Ancylobacter sp. 3268]MDR6953728.1 murein DD-endopeptidase MepM/ murein hydrolase activator NlpD [Ancylobacter sp. 3268]